MPAPSQLAIATSSVQRLVKEEASYHEELKQQQTRLDKLLANKDDGENAEYQLKQEASPSLLIVLQNLPGYIPLLPESSRGRRKSQTAHNQTALPLIVYIWRNNP